MLAVLWDRMAAGHAKSFQQEFSRDLKRLNHFQKTSSNPRLAFAALSRLLELKVFRAFRRNFSREELLRFQARLNKPN
ncbi:MAG: hypothetical protein JWM59_3475 [Verrucomicrobiales bacterium]|nr:hypothetical protein [Verrucomicrobiales bacterium]